MIWIAFDHFVFGAFMRGGDTMSVFLLDSRPLSRSREERRDM
jgi:hypothetical protein